MRVPVSRLFAWWVAVGLLAAGPARAATDTLQISHEPVKMAIRGQPLTLKARVTSSVGVQAVSLYYSLSKDAAPVKVAMKPVGLDFYLGTIEGPVLAGVPTISYYLEAENVGGAVKETPWHVIALRDAKPGESNAPPPPGGTRLPPPAKDDSGVSIGLIAGGAVAVVAGAVLLADQGDSGGGKSSGTPTDPASAAGTYQGSGTTCLTLTGLAPACEEHAITIVVDSKGTVFSDNLVAGQTLTDTLNGRDFTLVASVSSPTSAVTGQIYFNGTVLSDRIVGNITGSQTGGAQGPGTYSGSFSANKQ